MKQIEWLLDGKSRLEINKSLTKIKEELDAKKLMVTPKIIRINC